VRLRDRPVLLREVKVNYPSKARSLGIEGTVKVRLLIGPDGRVRKASVVSGPGFGLNQAARKALLEFRFQPAVGTDGKPMEHWITYRYTFRIDE
jgi:protein TonB